MVNTPVAEKNFTNETYSIVISYNDQNIIGMTRHNFQQTLQLKMLQLKQIKIKSSQAA